jgi:hypothetical protein
MPDLATALATIVMSPGRKMGNNLVENMGLNPQTVVVQQDSYDVEFTYIRYKIDHRTVCNRYRSDILAYSECTHAATKIFAEGCRMDSFGDKPEAQSNRLKLMFCNASASYKPVTARLSSSSGSSARTKASPECNAAILAVMSKSSAANIDKRERLCRK